MPIALKSGSLNFLEPSVTVQVCKGVTLLLPLSVCIEYEYTLPDNTC